MTERPIPSASTNAPSSPEAMAGFTRLPGFLRRWELPQVVQPGLEFVIENAGRLDGVDLFRVFHRIHAATAIGDGAQSDEANEVGIPVGLLLEGESAPLPGRLLQLGAGDPLMAVVVVDGGRRGASMLARVREHLAKAWSSKHGASHSGFVTNHEPVRGAG